MATKRRRWISSEDRERILEAIQKEYRRKVRFERSTVDLDYGPNEEKFEVGLQIDVWDLLGDPRR